MFWIFYVIGDAIGTLMNLRFSIPVAYFDLKNAWGVFGGIKTIGYHLIRITIWSCVVFFCSWVSVGYFVMNWSDLKDEIERQKW